MTASFEDLNVVGALKSSRIATPARIEQTTKLVDVLKAVSSHPTLQTSEQLRNQPRSVPQQYRCDLHGVRTGQKRFAFHDAAFASRAHSFGAQARVGTVAGRKLRHLFNGSPASAIQAS
jgi:hypothetical protein